jgi:hypothetical protein
VSAFVQEFAVISRLPEKWHRFDEAKRNKNEDFHLSPPASFR